MKIIGISGGSGSGKTYVTNKLASKIGLKNLSIIELDSYYKDLHHLKLKEREKNNFDHPNAFDFNLLINHLNNLDIEGKVSSPTYCYKKHIRKNEKNMIFKKQILIIEGIFSTFDKELREKMIYKVFIDAPENIRLKRRIKRDVDIRGRDIKSVKKQFNNSVLEMHNKFVTPLKKYADLVISSNDDSINKLYKKINQILLNE